MSLPGGRGMKMGREEHFEGKPGLPQRFILGKLRTSFLLSFLSLRLKGRKLKLVKNILCAKDFTYIISLKTLFYLQFMLGAGVCLIPELEPVKRILYSLLVLN